MPEFSHLHCHTQYSLLDGAANIHKLIEKAKQNEMPSLAITDHGNMFGVPEFVNAAKKEGIKPVIGCEFYVTPSGMEDRSDKRRFHQVLLAKNRTGYHNLAKLSSLGYLKGLYYKPRIDKETLAKYSEGLIATTCCVASEINQTILREGEDQARKIFEWYLDLFGEDYYIELQRHGLQDQDRCNEVLLKWAKQYNVKVIATNDAHYVDQRDSEAHDILLALQTNADINDTNRFRFTDDENNLNREFYLKNPDEMLDTFSDVPQAVDYTQEIVDKIEPIELKADLFLPHYQIPEQFQSMDDYLHDVAFKGAKQRYGELSQDITERIQQELRIIRDMGFAGYFLIVQDFTTVARQRNVYVGPGRGSAAGSVVAYCLGITNVDPMQYDLLFERFLNPERVNPPDIDIDFDDAGRQEVIDYVVEKYGRDNVAQIVTYGTMKAKTAIRDVGRVLGVPLKRVNEIAKYFPDKPGLDTFNKILDPSENPDTATTINELFEDPDPQVQKMMQFAKTLEGSARQTGIHAAGVIIAPGEVSDYVPVAVSKERDVITQYDGPSAEECGLLKMDFLGLRTLSILKTAIELVEENYGTTYRLDEIPQDDQKTFELYQKGQTVGTFQFESDGMRKYLKELQPTSIDDLIAMNALYRPGPMQFIPQYIRRKHGQEQPEYPHDSIRDILEPTYGIMIYQEQIMQIAQRMADYSLGEADLLRRAMGKKKVKEMEKHEKMFKERAVKKGIEKQTAQDVYDKMAEFANYGFNKSHSAAYSMVAYQTAFFKANYPAEYMASVLTHNMNDIKKVSQFIEECQRMGIKVNPPDINSAEGKFVAREGDIHYGMDAIKGVGSNAVQMIVEERKKKGEFSSIFNFASRIDLRACNRKTMESLIQAGAFDQLHPNRARLMASLDDVLNYAVRKQEEERMNQASLFGDSAANGMAQEPELRDTPAWSNIETLNRERELIGFYLSGHPLNRFSKDIELFCTTSLSAEDFAQLKENQDVTVAGIITEVKQASDKRGRPMAFFRIEDLKDSIEVIAFSDVYDRHMGLIQIDTIVAITGKVNSQQGQTKIIANSVDRIESLREKNQKNLQVNLNIDTSRVGHEDLEKVAGLFEENKGETSVQFNVRSQSAKGPLTMDVRKYTVDPNDELIRQIEEIIGEGQVSLSK